MYLALDSKYGNRVAVKKTRVYKEHKGLQNEVHILKQCDSDFIVRYYDAFCDQDSFYVSHSRLDHGIDCYGVLSIRFVGIPSGKGDSIHRT